MFLTVGKNKLNELRLKIKEIDWLRSYMINIQQFVVELEHTVESLNLHSMRKVTYKLQNKNMVFLKVEY